MILCYKVTKKGWILQAFDSQFVSCNALIDSDFRKGGSQFERRCLENWKKSVGSAPNGAEILKLHDLVDWGSRTPRENHEVLTTEREPAGQAKRSKSNKFLTKSIKIIFFLPWRNMHADAWKLRIKKIPRPAEIKKLFIRSWNFYNW